MSSLGWALIQYEWSPYKKRKFRYTKTLDRSIQREDHVNTHNEGSHLQTKERGFRAGLLRGEIKPANIVILRLAGCSTGRKIKVCCLSCPVWGILLHQPTKLIHSPLQKPCLGSMLICPGKHGSMEPST